MLRPEHGARSAGCMVLCYACSHATAFLQSLIMRLLIGRLSVEIFEIFFRETDKFSLSLHSVHWGCFGFDSIRHWTVSTPGSVGQPVNLDLQTISWQQLLCTRCVVCKAHYLNPRGQGYLADEYPSSL